MHSLPLSLSVSAIDLPLVNIPFLTTVYKTFVEISQAITLS